MNDAVSTRAPRPITDLADDHVRRLARLDPILAGDLGWAQDQDRLPDLSPNGTAVVVACRDTLGRLAALPAPTDPDERRCARLLTERLGAQIAHAGSGEPRPGRTWLPASPDDRYPAAALAQGTLGLDDPGAGAGRAARIAIRCGGRRRLLTTPRSSTSATSAGPPPSGTSRSPADRP